jgi:hypothetical protein
MLTVSDFVRPRRPVAAASDLHALDQLTTEQIVAGL